VRPGRRSGPGRAERTAEQDRAAGGPGRRLVDLGDGRTARASIELKVLPRTRRIRAYLRWSDKGKSPAAYLGEVAETTRTRNLTLAWRIAHQQGLVIPAQAPVASWASSPAVRAVMKANRGRDTKPELALRSAVHRLGLRYKVDAAPIDSVKRRADLVFPKAKVAVFCDGCYWHGCPEHFRPARQNHGFWSEKISKNQQRDRDTNDRLLAAGWLVIRVWEHDQPAESAHYIAQAVRSRTKRPDSTAESLTRCASLIAADQVPDL
jgi:DNA mismatch endonuclease (patch repair protein)